ncbi:MAG TPA: histidine phosphatase family protein [Micromonosporaceae bacterium]
MGGSWAAGRVARAVSDMATSHPGGRVVACSHGDVMPLFLALACAAYGTALPEIVDRGGWYHLELTDASCRLAAMGPRV